MKKYLRLGEIPTGGRSINFRALPLWRNSDFVWELANIGAASAYAEVPEKYLELGLSVFELDDVGNPILSNEDLLASYAIRVARKDNQFIVEGIEVGRGFDGEPLIQLVNREE